MTTSVSVEEQMRTLMRGVEFGDPHIQATMEAELRTRLAEGRPLRVYCGFDPTAVDLTLGHLVPMFKMRQFQRFGHDVTFVIGTMTGMIGDPTDRSAARQMLTSEQVNANAETWQGQALRVLDREKTTFRRNASWLAGMTLADMIQLASNFTVSQFLEKESFRKRLDEGRPVYVHEFMYAMMQAYDAHVLETDVQIGGVDQLFNIMAGRQLQKSMDERPLIAITTPLLLGTDGHLKMSKSVGNYIGIDDAPADMFGKIMSIPDSLIVNYYTLLTDTPVEEIDAIERGLAERTINPMETKKRLGNLIVSQLNGAEAGAAAQAEFERVFQRREEPEQAIEVAWKDLPFTGDGVGTAPAEISLPQLISKAGGISVGDARRLIPQGAVEVDGKKATTNAVTVSPGVLIKAGRHRFIRIVED
ncbi:MAG: tyrosine--tRNA ligase [Dehalococcoidia bacterium]